MMLRIATIIWPNGERAVYKSRSSAMEHVLNEMVRDEGVVVVSGRQTV